MLCTRLPKNKTDAYFSGMDLIIKFLLLVTFTGVISSVTPISAQSVSINSTGQSPDSSALLDLSSTGKGLLVPRLSTSQRNQIGNPAKALFIFNTTTNRFEVNTGTPAAPDWQAIPTLLSDEMEQMFWKNGGNAITQPVGTIGASNAKALSFATNGIMRLYIDSTQTAIGINTLQPKASLHVATTDALIVPVGTTQQRPLQPQPGMIRFNKDSGKLEGYTNEGWKTLQ
jgi:hypothetical protein